MGERQPCLCYRKQDGCRLRAHPLDEINTLLSALPEIIGRIHRSLRVLTITREARCGSKAAHGPNWLRLAPRCELSLCICYDEKRGFLSGASRRDRCAQA